MTDANFEEIVTQALRLPPAEQALLMERLAAALHDNLAAPSEGAPSEWTDAQWAQMLTPEPLPPAEVVARGLTGAWTHIRDGAEWVNEQKRKREAGRKWKFRQP